MPVRLPLLNRAPITYSSAAEHEDNIINKLAYVKENEKLIAYLRDQTQSIEALVAHHLGLSSKDKCVVLDQKAWMRGSFNICIPVEVIRPGRKTSKVVMRCPMPHKLAEARYPDTIGEKLSCEVGSHIWKQENCPHIPTPHLFGFGFPDGHHFTHVLQRPIYVRLAHTARRYLSILFRNTAPSQYIQYPALQSLYTGYMLFDYIKPDEGRMLSNTWDQYRQDPVRKQNLFRGMARIILSFARISQPRIGSFRFHNDGTITLTNRPLSCAMIILENDCAPRVIQKNDTYTCTEAFVSDMLTFHDNRFLSDQNAVYSESDCHRQMAVMTLLRALSHHFLLREHRQGPYVVQLTDFHASNIFVDDEWHITYLLDLEWMCALPIDALEVPYWLTGRAIDQVSEHLDEYDAVRQEFMDIFEEEERKISPTQHNMSIARTMHNAWESKRVWFWNCLLSVNGMSSLFEDYIYPMFSPKSLNTMEVMSIFWRVNSSEIVAKKLADKEQFSERLRRVFDQENAS